MSTVKPDCDVYPRAGLWVLPTIRRAKVGGDVTLVASFQSFKWGGLPLTGVLGI